MSSRNENLKEEALNLTRWGIRFGKGYGLIVRQYMMIMMMMIMMILDVH